MFLVNASKDIRDDLMLKKFAKTISVQFRPVWLVWAAAVTAISSLKNLHLEKRSFADGRVQVLVL